MRLTLWIPPPGTNWGTVGYDVLPWACDWRRILEHVAEGRLVRGGVPRSMLLTTCLELVLGHLTPLHRASGVACFALHCITLHYITLRHKAAQIALQAYQSKARSTSIQGSFMRKWDLWETSSFRQELARIGDRKYSCVRPCLLKLRHLQWAPARGDWQPNQLCEDTHLEKGALQVCQKLEATQNPRTSNLNLPVDKWENGN